MLEPLALLCVTISCSCIIFENCFQHVDAPLLLGELLGLLGGTAVSFCGDTPVCMRCVIVWRYGSVYALCRSAEVRQCLCVVSLCVGTAMSVRCVIVCGYGSVCALCHSVDVRQCLCVVSLCGGTAVSVRCVIVCGYGSVCALCDVVVWRYNVF